MSMLTDLLPAFTFAQQRATCEACVHLLRAAVSVTPRCGPTLALRCTARKGTRGCSLMRAPGQPCGPEAALFQPKDGA